MVDSPRNPWFAIPLADYEAHMSLPEVGQAALLSDVLASAICEHDPKSVAVFGCAGGNGFDRVPAAARLVGVDVNPEYVAVARRRFAGRSGLDLQVADVTVDALSFAPVELAFAGLLFEHVDAAMALANIGAKLLSGGTLVAVLQLPNEHGNVTPSPYTSLEALATSMHLLAPAELDRAATVAGFELLAAAVVRASGGKDFAVQTYRIG